MHASTARQRRGELIRIAESRLRVWQDVCDRCTAPGDTLGKDVCDLELLHAVRRRQGFVSGVAAVKGWCYRGKSCEHRNLRGHGGARGCRSREIAGLGWLRHWASPVRVLRAVFRVLQIDAIRA